MRLGREYYVTETDMNATLDECPRCGRLVFAGRVDGANVRLDTRTVPPMHAAILHEYGLPIMVADPATTGLQVQVWQPCTHDLTRTGRHLLAPHTCAAPRLRGK